MEKEVLYIKEIERLKKQLDEFDTYKLTMANAALQAELTAMTKERDAFRAAYNENSDEIERLREHLKLSEVMANMPMSQVEAELREQLAAVTRERDECVTALELLHVVTTACQKDAERYRWLLTQQVENEELRWLSYTYIKKAHSDMNAAIDAAMKGEK